MSFIESNQYFIKNEFHGKMKGLSFDEKVQLYRNVLQLETRRRIREHFKKQIPVHEKVKDYDELLHLLKDFDFEYLLISIYFDQDSTVLFQDLEHSFEDCTPKLYNDRFILLPLLKFNPNKAAKSVKLFLKSFFIRFVDVTDNEWMNKDDTYHLIKKFVSWLKSSLKQQSAKELIFISLFHYSKLWSLGFSRPYKYDHGIMLLKELSNFLIETNESERSDFRQMLIELKSILQSLPCHIPEPPFLDLEENHSSKVGYLKWLNEFKIILNTKGNTTQSSQGPSFKELVNLYYDQNSQKQNQLYEIFKNKLLDGQYPTNEEIELLRHKYYSAKDRNLKDSKRLYKEFVRMTYQFESIELIQ